MFAQPPGTYTFLFLFGFNYLLSTSDAVKCLDCVGKNCMGAFCEGDYCVLSHYAPRWGTVEWGDPRVVKGCMNGTMVRKDVRSHCEVADGNEDDVFTCFCNGKDYCNGDKAVDKLETEPVQLLTCVCEGAHCKSPTCLGELCSYVINHKTKQTEQGCVNASVPIVERRSAGACMIPPITGAMHHTVAKNAEELLMTESCVCGTDYCNMEKPEVTVPEKMKCQTFVRAEMASKNVTCTGEFCFKAHIKSKIGHMSEYRTIGCASFIDDAELAEELNPVGCAKFISENVEVEACMNTNDKRAIGRARANQQVPEKTNVRRVKGKPKGKAAPKPKMELSYEEEEDEEERPPPRRPKPIVKEKTRKEVPEEPETEKPEEEGRPEEGEPKEAPEGEEETPEEGAGEGEEEEGGEKEASKEPHYIFERPTEPPVPEDSNATLIAVFLLIMLLIVLSGVVWKFELHKKLFRSSYDTVAGG